MQKHSVATATLAALALGGMLWTANTARAHTPFDGAWSVLIVTDAGSCDRAYRYALRIANGRIFYPDQTIDVSGHVDARGHANVSGQRRRPAGKRLRSTLRRSRPGLSGTEVRQTRDAPGIGKQSAAAEAGLARTAVDSRKANQRKMPERWHRPAFDDTDAAVPRRPLREPLPAKFRPPAQPPRQGRE